jgi:predicted nucleic acid-binding protein
LRTVYFDSAYLVKCYIKEPDSSKVLGLVQSVEAVYSSTLSIAELACTLHRGVREKVITRVHAAYMRQAFSGDSSRGVVRLIPVSEDILRAVEATVARMPDTVFLRASDAIHLASAQLEGFAEIWTNDRHMLKAAPHFGLAGRSI